MTAEKVARDVEKKNVLVGIRLDSQSKELLSWALVKVADPGDRVIAVHVCRTSGDASKQKLLLDDYLETYKRLCEVKKVDLSGEILTGKSIQRSLVKEAKNCAAVAVVIGISKKAALGGWMSVGKYCAKHLPPTTEVLTIHNGKVVFRRSSSEHLPLDPKPSFCKLEKQSFANSESQPEVLEIDRLAQCSEQGSIGSFGADDSIDDKPSCSVPNRKEAPSRLMNLYEDRASEQMPGWPLLRKSSRPNQNALPARKMSVVQWVMSLPDRSLPETTQSSSDSCSSKSGSLLGREFSDSVHSRINSISVWSGVLEESGQPFPVDSSDFTWFSYEVLKTSTSNFSLENLIGKGGCSRVYKGLSTDGKPVAVKVMKASKEAWKNFSLEINIISSLKHKTIIPLLGVCIDNDELISVYEFMPKGSLEQNLHDHNRENVALSWETRFKIAVGVAEVLNHLHSRCPKPIIHRDVKSSNILLSDGFKPKLSDFGLAVWGPTSSSSETYDDVVGTFGYLAPEYFMYGKVSDKIDVYSFGVVLLELLSGRKPIGFNSSYGQQSLVMWAQPILESGKLREILDPDLEGNHDETQMKRMILAATLCLTRSARLRPNMSQIVKLLKGEETVEEWINSSKYGQEENLDVNDDEVYVNSSAKSHLSLALLDVHDEFTSCSSVELDNSPSLEEYLKGRWSQSSSFD
ncbi:hypothetical protein Ancab_028076 [Ancistrocladus abbreviatus]